VSSLASWADKAASDSSSRELADIYKWEDVLKRCLEIKPTHQIISQTIIDLLLNSYLTVDTHNILKIHIKNILALHLKSWHDL